MMINKTSSNNVTTSNVYKACEWIDAKKAKGYFLKFTGTNEIVYLCENFTIGLKIYRLFGATVICCLLIKDFVEVAKIIKKLYPVTKFIVVADKEDKISIKHAKRTKKVLKARIVYPRFAVKQAINSCHCFSGTLF